MRFFGQLDEAAITDMVKQAFSTGGAEPGVDRIIVIEPSTEVHDLDSGALRRIQLCVQKEEQRSGQEVSFRTVFVHSSPMHTPLLLLYKAIWDERALPGVEFFVASSLAEAAGILGVELPEGTFETDEGQG